jgi:hypothetical protein
MIAQTNTVPKNETMNPLPAVASKSQREAWFDGKVQRVKRKHRNGWINDASYAREIDCLSTQRRKGAIN